MPSSSIIDTLIRLDNQSFCRGCIFVGHGLSQDFSALNLFVPPAQIIDTLLIYHLENRRYISLRFLVNFFLERDMQQDTHDSIEDSKAAFDLYQLAVKLTKEGQFQKKLRDLYDYGESIDWKIGVLNR
jgi:PAB-dependent poly(A)-specific ribonuclease subunit 2